MRSHRNSVALASGPERPLFEPSIDERGSRGGRSLALVVTVLAILMMVAM
jgi:hypothetical protein